MQPLDPISTAPRPPVRGGIPIWLPWVLAPGFLLLPIAGCGAAATLRRSAFKAAPTADSAGSPPALVPVMTVAANGTPRR
jgi:hypothetical protein